MKTLHLSPSEVARALGVTTRTLGNQRSLGTGPEWIKFDGHVLYPTDFIFI